MTPRSREEHLDRGVGLEIYTKYESSDAQRGQVATARSSPPQMRTYLLPSADVILPTAIAMNGKTQNRHLFVTQRGCTDEFVFELASLLGCQEVRNRDPRTGNGSRPSVLKAMVPTANAHI